jgi:phosphoribosylformylglycinamidine synthase
LGEGAQTLALSHARRAVGAQPCNAVGSPAPGAQPAKNSPVFTDAYPLNPNGSPFGITALTTTTGRVTILMPHPERVFRTAAMSWHPADWPEDSPWMRLFRNARAWVG